MLRHGRICNDSGKKIVDRKSGFMIDIRIRFTETEGGTGDGED
jgi:hypothetical protein